MKKTLSENIGRRNFIKKSVLGTAGVAVSTSMLHENLHAQTDSYKNDFKEGIFPFYRFVHDFNFGEFIPKDQGGKFVQMELIGSEKDQIIVKKLVDGLIEQTLGKPTNWGLLEKSELEKSVWFNRFYYLPSFARLYYLDKKTEHLKNMMSILNGWIKLNPVEGPSDSKYNWFDMQVAWRSINLSWCYYLGKEGLTENEKLIIYNLQAEHAKILMKDFGRKELNEFNHQSHGALAILYLALLFPELKESKDLLQVAIKIINHHVVNAFYSDGANIEQMFGYYPFMTSVFRDVYLLLEANKITQSEELKNLLLKMYSYLLAIAQPDNTVPPINDSFEETISFIIPTLEGIIGYDRLPNKPYSKLFNDAEVAVFRSEINAVNKWYVNINAAKVIGSHAHAGRLAMNFWFNDKPIFVDSGCCNYDNPLLVEWYRTSAAHNTVIIDGKSDLATSQKEVQWAGKRYTANKITNFDISTDIKFCRMNSPKSDITNVGVEWTRDIILVLDKYLLVHDYFETDKPHDYQTIFRFSDLDVESKGNEIIIGSNLNLKIGSLGKSLSLDMEKNYFGTHAKNILTPTAIFKHQSNGINHSIFMISEEKENCKIACKEYSDRIEIFFNEDLLKIMNPKTEGEVVGFLRG